MEYYWEITQHDGTTTDVPPSAVEVVKRRWNNGEPIHFTNETIPANQIKSFRQTSKPFGQQPLLEAAAQAFNEPVLNEDGSIVVRWVKKLVTQRDWNKLYAGIPAYRRLGEDRGMVVMAVRLPVHQIDVQVHTDCTEEELQHLK